MTSEAIPSGTTFAKTEDLSYILCAHLRANRSALAGRSEFSLAETDSWSDSKSKSRGEVAVRGEGGGSEWGSEWGTVGEDPGDPAGACLPAALRCV